MGEYTDNQKRTWVEHLNAKLANESQQPVLAFPEGQEDETGFKYYTPAQLRTLALQAASFYAEQGLSPRQKGGGPLVVALFGYGTIEWAVSSA